MLASWLKIGKRGVSAVTVALVISGMAVMPLVFRFVSDQVSLQKDVGMQMQLQGLISNIVSTLDNDTAWAKTIASNPGMACLASGGSVCGAGNFGLIDVILANGVPIVSSAASAGFDAFGRPCNAFDAVNGHRECEFRIEMRWNCGGGACAPTAFTPPYPIATAPLITFAGTVLYSPNDPDDPQKKHRLKQSALDFSFVRTNQRDSITSACRAMGGVFDQNTNTCIVLKGGSCPNTHTMGGFDAGGNVVCRPLPFLDYRCPSDNAVVGVAANGNLRCYAF